MESTETILTHPSAILLNAKGPTDTVYRLAWFRVCDLYPEAANRIANDLRAGTRPLVLSEMKEIKKLVWEKKEPNTLSKYRSARDLFIAIALSIYDPAYFMSKKQLRQGLRDMLKSALEHKGAPTGMSHFARAAADYMNVSPPFALEVQAFKEWVLSKIDQQQK